MIVTGLPDRIARRVDRAVTDEEVPRGAYQTQLIEVRHTLLIDTICLHCPFFLGLFVNRGYLFSRSRLSMNLLL